MSSEVREMVKSLCLALLVALLAPSAASAGVLALAEQAQVTAQDVYDYINLYLEASAQTKAILIAAFQKAFQEGAIAPERALSFLMRVNGSGASLPLREQVYLTVADALMKGIPVEMLLSKVEEGLAKGRPMEEILAEIQERKQTLEEVKVLLEGKGFKVGVELHIGSATLVLSFEFTGAVITDVAGALEDYVRNGNDPADSLAVYQAVTLRLQRDRSLPQGLAAWVSGAVTPEELSRIAQNIATRLAPKG
jgi:hypothetical protein